MRRAAKYEENYSFPDEAAWLIDNTGKNDKMHIA